MRFRDIEFRWSDCNSKYELVRWCECPTLKKEYCYVVAFFDKDKECYNMRTIGDRFFDDKDAWVVGKYGLEFLNAIFDIEEQERDEV